jgi:hypothetical protein
MTLIGEIAGEMSTLPGITCWLYEGAITRAISQSRTGLDMVTVTRESPLEPGDLVEMFDSEYFDYHLTEGLPVVRKIGGSIPMPYAGEIISQPDRALAIPQSNGTISDLHTMIQSGYLRKATVEFYGLSKTTVAEVVVPHTTPASVLEVGDPALLIFDSSEETFYFNSSGSGQGPISFHHVEGNTTSDVIGIVLLGFGMTPMEVV